MNREIKFRVWDKRKNEFVVNYEEEPISSKYRSKCFDLWEWAAQMGTCLTYPIDDYVFQQFTGMKDKMGHEVYEGDIVCENMTEETAVLGGESLLGEVYFAAGTFMIDGDGPLFDHTFSTSPDILEDFTVVGNVFENPELLKHHE
jgi:uncharacterized phage protein (TIGR01671 family)